MLVAFGARHLPLSSHSAHCAVALLALAVVVLAPNIRLLPEVWTGSFYNDKRLAEVLLLCSYGLLLILSPTARVSWCGTLVALPLTARTGFAAILGLGLLSAGLAARPDAALLELANGVLLFVLVLGIATEVRETGQRTASLFVCGLAVMALAYETRFLAGLLAMLVEQASFSSHDLFPGFVNLRFFNQMQTWTMPLLALPLWLARRSLTLRSLVFTVLALWWLLLFIAAGRGALLAICGGATLTFVVFQKRSLPWLATQIFAAGTALVAYFALAHFALSSQAPSNALPQRVAHLFEDPTRLRLLHDAWDLFLHDPVLGAGPMHYAYYLHDSYLHPHNSLLQLLSEWGLPATLMLLLLSSWAISAWAREVRKTALESDELTVLTRVALFASISGAALHSLVSGIIVMPLSQLLAACVAGLMLGDYLSMRSDLLSKKPSHTNHDRVLVVGLAGAALALGALSATTLFQARDIQLHAQQYRMDGVFIQQHSFNPRFWLPGQLKNIEKNGSSSSTMER